MFHLPFSIYILAIRFYIQTMRRVFNPFLRRLQRRQKKPFLKKIAALDLGTNACRLLIAEIQHDQIKVVDSFSRAVCLGEGLQKNGNLSESAIQRTLHALRICKKKLNHHHLDAVRCVTTEACRQAANSTDFLEQVKTALNLDIEIISQEEEARLALAGCAALLKPHVPYAIAFDIGGGSTEIMWLKKDHEHEKSNPLSHEILDWISLPFGVVTLSELFGKEKSTRATFNEICTRITQKLKEFSEKNNISHYFANNLVQFIGTSGTVTTLAALHLNLTRYERGKVDGLTIETSSLDKITNYLLDLPEEERNSHACLSEQRGDLICVGSAILVGIYKTWDAKAITVADRGVREGILIDLMHQVKNTSPRSPSIQEPENLHNVKS